MPICSGDLATLLTGRYMEISMLPLSFREYLELVPMPVERALAGYMRTGGMPHVAMMDRSEEKIDVYLEGIYNTVVVRDIENRQAREESDPDKRKVTDIVLLKNPPDSRPFGGAPPETAVNLNIQHLQGVNPMENNCNHNETWIAPNATVIGDVTLAKDVTVWYGAVLRGDSGPITIGEGTNIQDNAIMHEKTTVGKYCTIGHGAIVHGCTVGDNCVIGMGAIVLGGAVLGNNCLVGAGAVVTGKTIAPDGSMLLGSPAKVVKTLTPEQIAGNRHSAEHYIHLAFGQGEK